MHCLLDSLHVCWSCSCAHGFACLSLVQFAPIIVTQALYPLLQAGTKLRGGAKDKQAAKVINISSLIAKPELVRTATTALFPAACLP